MTTERSEDLFSEGWREPGDDCERMMFYFMVALMVLIGYAMTGWGLWTLAFGAHSPERIGGLIVTVVGGSMGGFGTLFFVKESKHWDLRHLTADRFVAGGFLFGLALILLGFQIGTHSGSVGGHLQTHHARDVEGGFVVAGWLFGAGVVDLTLFLVLGLLFAYAPALRLRHRFAGAYVERRYAIDDKLCEIDEHPCPRVDGMTPVVTLRLRDGRTRTLVCAESAYESVKTGTSGTAVVRGKRLERFHVA